MKTLWHPGYQFPSFAIFSHETCHVTIINGYVTRRPQDILLGKKIRLVLAILAKDIANQSLDLCQALNPGLELSGTIYFNDQNMISLSHY